MKNIDWFKQAQTPEVFVGSYIGGLLAVYINGKKYEYYMNPTQKKHLETLLRYNKGNALAYLRTMERF